MILPAKLLRPVFLVGFMGAGKTSVARRIARRCGIASVDTDTYLERRIGKAIKDLFAEEGEEAFRLIETDILKELAAKEPLLISCGGGIVCRPQNREFLKQAGVVVYLVVTAEEAAGRISDFSARPLFKDKASAHERCEARRPLYEEVADITVDTAGKSMSALAWEVQGLLEKEGVLWLQQR